MGREKGDESENARVRVQLSRERGSMDEMGRKVNYTKYTQTHTKNTVLKGSYISKYPS